MCARENCARMTAFPGAAWTGLHHTPKSGKPTFLRQEGASEMADARLPINEHHPRTRQTDKPCRAECQVVCSHMDRHHQSFHRHTSHHPLVTSTHVNTCSTAHVNTCSTAKNTTGVGVIALQPCAKASRHPAGRQSKSLSHKAPLHAPCSTHEKKIEIWWCKGVQTSRFPRKSNLSTQ